MNTHTRTHPSYIKSFAIGVRFGDAGGDQNFSQNAGETFKIGMITKMEN
jgi:hypothetical protein